MPKVRTASVIALLPPAALNSAPLGLPRPAAGCFEGLSETSSLPEMVYSVASEPTETGKGQRPMAQPTPVFRSEAVGSIEAS